MFCSFKKSSSESFPRRFSKTVLRDRVLELPGSPVRNKGTFVCKQMNKLIRFSIKALFLAIPEGNLNFFINSLS